MSSIKNMIEQFLQDGTSFERKEIAPDITIEKMPSKQKSFLPHVGLVLTKKVECLKKKERKTKKSKKKIDSKSSEENKDENIDESNIYSRRLLCLTDRIFFDHLKQLLSNPYLIEVIDEITKINKDHEAQNKIIYEEKKVKREKDKEIHKEKEEKKAKEKELKLKEKEAKKQTKVL